MRENKIVPYVPPGDVCARLFCARTGANSWNCTDACNSEDSRPVGSTSEGELGLSSYLTGGSRCTSFCGSSSLLSFSKRPKLLVGAHSSLCVRVWERLGSLSAASACPSGTRLGSGLGCVHIALLGTVVFAALVFCRWAVVSLHPPCKVGARQVSNLTEKFKGNPRH